MSDHEPQSTSTPATPTSTPERTASGKPSGNAQQPRKNNKSKHKSGGGKIPAANRPGARAEKQAMRHQARILAMQMLFERDLANHDLDEILERMSSDEELSTPPPVTRHATRLTNGVLAQLLPIDTQIGKAAPAFPVDQLASIDRNVLRIAIFELLHEDVPPRAVINEAVEIAKDYGGPSSGKFVNGVLGTIMRALPQKPAPVAKVATPPAEPDSPPESSENEDRDA